MEALNEMIKRLLSAMQDARFSHEVPKSRQAAYSGQKFNTSPYKAGDKLWANKTLFRHAIAESQQSKKLTARRFGPFTVTKLIGKNTIRLDLPANIKIHIVVHVAHSTPFKSRLADIALLDTVKIAPVPMQASDEFVVSKIVKHRWCFPRTKMKDDFYTAASAVAAK